MTSAPSTPASGVVASAVAAVLLSGALSGQDVQAQIAGDPSAPANQRPTVITAPNGVPLVNIQTPSAGGVSRNTYSQFDVGPNGAILNNSRTNVQTQQGGWVQGNPWLARGPARIILNEVNSSNPSQLRGYVEVAGQRAEVIIANPAGIQVNGGGFINASRATLTTGAPQFSSAGDLESFLVRGGTISIDGAGLDASKTDYTAILARAVQVNAGIWASELKVVAGASQVTADAGSATPIAGSTEASPAFALDVAQLGGMYAGKITLVGTEAGLGVRNAGHVGAGAGELVVRADGRLENTGVMEGSRLELASSSELRNSGVLRQSGSADLALTAPTLRNVGGIVGPEPVSAAGGGSATPGSGSDTGTGTTSGGGTGGTPTTSGGASDGGTPAIGTAAPAYIPPSPGTIQAAGGIDNSGGRIYAGGTIQLDTPQIDNSAGGQITVAQLQVSGPAFSNAGGTLNVSQGFSANVGRFDNAGGTLNAGSLNIATSSGHMDNRGGTLNSNADASLQVAGDLLNAGGTIASVGALDASAGGQVDNTADGQLMANQNLQLRAQTLTNTGGAIQSSGGATQVQVAGQLNNGAGGAIGAATDLSVQAGQLANTGSLRAGRDGLITAQGNLTNDGSITSAGNTRVQALSLQSSATGVLGAGVKADGSLGSAGNLQVDTTQALAAHGTQLAAGSINLTGASIDLSGNKSQTSAATISATARSGDITTSGATVVAPGTLALTANTSPTQSLINEGGTLNAGQLDLHLANLRNSGQIAQTGVGATQLAVGGAIDNSGGTLASNGDLALQAASLRNQSGTIQSAGNLQVSIQGAASNAGGTLAAGEHLAVSAAALDNTGALASGQSVAIDTRGGALTNKGGTLGSSAGALNIDSGALDNTAGLIQSAGDLRTDTRGQQLVNRDATLYAGTPDGSGSNNGKGHGGITSAGALQLTTGQLDNSAGFIAAQGGVTAVTGAVTNAAGRIVGAGGLRVNTQGAAFNNNGAGQVQSVGDLTIHAGSIDNSSALMRTGGNATLTAASLTNRDTQGADQGIEATGLSITAASIDNTRGALRAAQDATLTSTRIDNSAGWISGQRDLSLLDPQAGIPGAKTLDVINTGGTLVANRDLRIDSAKLSSNGTTTAGRDLTMALTQNVVNNVDVGAGRNLSYTTTGRFTNNAKLTAGGTLTVGGAAGIDNNAAGEMSGADTVVQTGATLNNRGLIDSVGHTQIDAGTLNNTGTGRIYGDRISIEAGTLNNAPDTLGGPAGTIASRTGDIDLGVGQLNNSDGALIYSGADLYIGRALDVDRYSTGRANQVTNLAANIEATGNMSLAAQQLDNLNRGFTTKEVTTNEALGQRLIGFPDSSERYTQDELGRCYKCVSNRNDSGAESLPRAEWVRPSERYPFSAGYARHPYALPSNGATYADGDPVWTLFSVAPGDSATLNAALSAYNEDLMNRAMRDYQDVRITNRETTQTVVDNAGVAGRIASGGDMWLDIGSGRNANSQVIAGGNLGGNADQLKNEGVTGTRTVVETGTWNGYAIEYSPYGRLKSTGQGEIRDVRSDSIEVTTAVRLSAGNPGVVGKSPQRAQVGQASATAGGTGTADGSIRPGAIFEVAANPGAAQGAGGTGASSSADTVIRTTTPNGAIPKASLFGIRSAGSYLIETDPRFANYRQWLSSDYLFTQLGLDPQTTQKRLGDGFYEQKLIREQVAQLTGQRYLDGYSSDEQMYAALMNAGATFAKEFQLTPGVGLTAAQMAQLTSDIVWLVEQEVTLPDGSVQKVLVPQLYVRAKDGDIQGNGALIAGNSVDLKINGNLTNKDGATIAGRTALKIDAGSIDVLNGARIHGGDVDLKTKEDLNVIGASVTANNSLSLSAGRDLNVKSTTRSDSSTGVGYASSNTHIDRVAGLYVGGEGKGALIASAGNDANLIGAIIANQGSGTTTVKAGNDVNLGTLTTGDSSRYQGKGSNYSSSSHSQEVGSQIQGNGGVGIGAGNDINIRQGKVDAGDGLLLMNAGNNISITAGRNISDTESQATGTVKNGLGLSKTTTTSYSQVHDDKAQVSSINGGLVSISAGGLVSSEGTRIIGQEGVYISGAGGVELTEARDIHSETRSSQSKTSGLNPLTSTGIPDIGNPKQGTVTTTESNTAVKGLIESTQGGITITGQDSSVRVQGVDLQAEGNLAVRGGGGVSITGATNFSSTTTERSAKGAAISAEPLKDAAEGWGAKKSGTGTNTQSELVRTELSGANIELQARKEDGALGNVVLAGTTLTTPGTLSVEADKLLIATQQTTTSTSSQEQKRDLIWQKSRDSGQVDQDTHYVQINAGQLDLGKVGKINADLGAKDSVEQLAQQPGMAWANQLLTDASLKDKVDWSRVEEAHEKWNYKQQGLTPEGAAIVTAVVTYLTWGAASGVGAAAGEAAATGLGAAAGGTVSTVVGGAVTAGLSTLAAQASVALINNRGNIGHALDELGSSSSVKNLLTAIVTGGVLGGLSLNPTGLPTVNGGASEFMKQLGTNLTAGTAKAVVSIMINGGSLEEGLKSGLLNAFLDTVAAQGAFGIGSNIEPGSVANMLAHAMAGCVVGAARTDGSCGAGALGAAIGELAASLYDPGALNTHGDTVQFAAMMSSLAAGVAGLDATEINQAGQAGANAAANNWLATKQRAQAKQELAAAKTPLEALQVAGKWAAVGVKQDVLTASGVGLGLAESGINDIEGMATFLANPVEGFNGIKQLINSPEAREQFGDSVFRELDAKIDRMQLALAEGGDQSALQLGKDLGSLIYQIGSVVIGAGAAAKGGVAVVNAAASLGTRSLESAALQFMKLDAGAIKGFKSAEEINAMMKAAPDWSPAWKPGSAVAEATIKPGTTVRMVVDERAYKALTSPDIDSSRAFGGWATFDEVPNVSYARNQLAITTEMKSATTPLYVVEVQVTRPINAQVGVVGEQGAAAGGGNQLHFILPPGERPQVFQYVAGTGRVLR